MNPSQLSIDPTTRRLAEEVAAAFAALPQVEAVWLGGSHASGRADDTSDLDLYVYTSAELPVAVRSDVIEPRASVAEVGYDFWEVEDYWLERASGTKAEAMYRRPEWETQHLEDLFANSRAQLGFSTTRWAAVVHARVLFDRSGWSNEVKALADRPYPDDLAAAIIRSNVGVLRGTLVTQTAALTAALERDDLVFAYSRVTGILNSYFDALFALNQTLHPGAKRQLAAAQELALTPEGMIDDVGSLLRSPIAELPEKAERLIDGLEGLLRERGALPSFVQVAS